MAQRSNRSSRKELPRARKLSYATDRELLSCGIDPASLPYLKPKLGHRNLLLKNIKLYAANILKQSMLSIGGDVAVHRQVISGKIEHSNCILMGDLRHYRLLIEKLRLQPGLESIAETIEEQVFSDSTKLELDLCGQRYQWKHLPVIMGILNTTPDSFSDGGLFSDPEKALDHALSMEEQGAEIIDIGGESSRPGAQGIEPEEEINRVIPVIRKVAAKIKIPISIDTSKASVARAAVDAGACLINDIHALGNDPDMLSAVRDTHAGVILMHMRGTPKNMQDNTSYNDIIDEIFTFLARGIEQCLEAGIDPSSILIDPGIGFGKDLSGNLHIIKHIEDFRSLKMPVVLGHSRKSFIGAVIDTPSDKRQEGTDAVSAWAVVKGVDMLRVHDVGHTHKVRTMIRAILESL
ncbi:MAG TPA: dihydropteroate synthase [Deltaproteobacteria bacterium]|nr:dihydropteroate synthase [Deltaproteobacteria bacterium]